MPRTPPDLNVAGVRSSKRIRTPAICPTVVLGWAGAATLVVAGATLATVTFAGGDDGKAEAPSGRTDTVAPACVWTPHVDGPVFPAEDLGGPPTPESVLAFEACNGEWTGDLAWMTPGEDRDAALAARADELERRARLEGQRRTHRSDDGLPNPSVAGDRAVERLQE
jgi:hypothetical protein